MVRRFVDLLKYSCLALALVSLTCVVGCGDNATAEPEAVVEEGSEDDPDTLAAEGPSADMSETGDESTP